MSFGFTIAPKYFIDITNTVFQNYIDSCRTVFINDLLVYSKSMDEYIDHLRVVFQVFKEH